MKLLKYITSGLLSLMAVFTLSIVLFPSQVKATFSQYGMIGIYNLLPFTLTDGQGSAISTDSQGRVLLSPSSTISLATSTIQSSITANGFLVNASSTNPTSTYYVDGTNGSDSNDCLTSATACKTLVNAYNKTCEAVLPGAIDIKVATGTYNESLPACRHFDNALVDGNGNLYTGGGYILIEGDTPSSTAVVLGGDNTVTNNRGGVLNLYDSGFVEFRNLTVSSTWTSGANPTAIICRHDSIFRATDVNWITKGGALDMGDGCTADVGELVNNTSTYFTKVQNTNAILVAGGSFSKPARIILANSIDFNHSVNALAISTGNYSAVNWFSGSGTKNLNFNGVTGTTQRAIVMTGFSQFIPSCSGTCSMNFYNFNAGDVTAALKASAIQLLSGSRISGGGTTFTFLFNNVKIPIAFYEGSAYAESTVTNWSFTNGSTSTPAFWLDPTSYMVGATGQTWSGATQVQGWYGRSAGNASTSFYGSGVAPIVASTTPVLGGSSLSAGTCATTTISMIGARMGMVVDVTPNTTTDIGGSFFTKGYVQSNDNVVAGVCAAVTGAPSSTTYTVRLIQ